MDKKKKGHTNVIKYTDKDKKCREETAFGSVIGGGKLATFTALRKNCSTHTKY